MVYAQTNPLQTEDFQAENGALRVQLSTLCEEIIKTNRITKQSYKTNRIRERHVLYNTITQILKNIV